MQKENVKVVNKNKVILNLIQDLQRTPLCNDNNKRGRFRIKYGMTSLFNNGNGKIGRCRIKCGKTLSFTGFTLIELLVVVLIIGILAAVAVPQYQQAVLKSRLATVMSNVKTLAQASELYYMANGEYPNDETTDLDISDLSGCTQEGGGNLYCGNIRYDYNAGSYHETSNLYDQIRGIVGHFNSSNEFVIQVSYIQYLEHSPQNAGNRYCLADDSSKLSAQVCKSLGGTSVSDDYYLLP